jgi:hypothetical protein
LVGLLGSLGNCGTHCSGVDAPCGLCIAPVKPAGAGQAAQLAPPCAKPWAYVPDAQIPHVMDAGLDRSILPLAVAAPKPGLQVSQSVKATAAIVSVVDVPAGQRPQAREPIVSL